MHWLLCITKPKIVPRYSTANTYQLHYAVAADFIPSETSRWSLQIQMHLCKCIFPCFILLQVSYKRTCSWLNNSVDFRLLWMVLKRLETTRFIKIFTLIIQVKLLINIFKNLGLFDWGVFPQSHNKIKNRSELFVLKFSAD